MAPNNVPPPVPNLQRVYRCAQPVARDSHILLRGTPNPADNAHTQQYFVQDDGGEVCGGEE